MDVAALFAVLAGVPGVDLLALDAGRLLAEPVGGEQLAVQDQVCQIVVFGALQRVMQIRSLGAKHLDDLVQLALSIHGDLDSGAVSEQGKV
ncbi:hypothetical protein, partial [Kibdelosporangium philippinense]